MVILVLFVFLVNTGTQEKPALRLDFTGLDDLSYPKSPPDTYCDIWRQKAQDFGKNVWFDRPSAYSAKRIVKEGGWTEVDSP